MIKNKNSIKPGATLIDDIGRRHHVEDVFVPKNAGTKRYQLPSAFRDVSRRVIVFLVREVLRYRQILRKDIR